MDTNIGNKRGLSASTSRFMLLFSALLVGAVATVAFTSESRPVNAAGSTTAFMGVMETVGSNINPDSWALGGSSTRLDFELDGTAKFGVLGHPGSTLAATLRHSTVHRQVRSDFADNLAWLNEPADTRGLNPCDRTVSDTIEITSSAGDKIFVESVGDTGACFDGARFVLRGRWAINGGTGVFENATGSMDSWGVGGQGRSREVLFGLINH